MKMPVKKPAKPLRSSAVALPLTLLIACSGVGQSQPPAGYTVDHNRTKLGDGEETYQRAVLALKNWNQFDLGWVTIVPRRSGGVT